MDDAVVVLVRDGRAPVVLYRHSRIGRPVWSVLGGGWWVYFDTLDSAVSIMGRDAAPGPVAALEPDVLY